MSAASAAVPGWEALGLGALALGFPAGEPLGGAEEARLVRAARLGSREARERLYAAHVARIYRTVRAVSLCDADAEDATQDAFVDALLHLDRYEGRPGIRLIAWLATLALNRARKRRAAAGRTRPAAPAALAILADREAVPVGPGGEEAVLRRRALLAALATLPERDREIVALYHGAELSAEEVGRAVGASAVAVRKACERARRQLAGWLEEREEAP